jgi:hypothetical protein
MIALTPEQTGIVKHLVDIKHLALRALSGHPPNINWIARLNGKIATNPFPISLVFIDSK